MNSFSLENMFFGCCFVGGALLLITGKAADLSEGRKQISEAVIGGAALSKFQAMLEAQGVAKETAQALCSAHTDYFQILRKSKHQMELETPADGKTKTGKQLQIFPQILLST